MKLLARKSGVGGRRFAKMAVVLTGTLLTYLVVPAIPAQAATTCSGPVDLDPDLVGVVNETTVAIAPDDTVALRVNDVTLDLEKIDNPPASLLGAVWGPCALAGDFDVVRINGTNLGHETVRLVNGGDGAEQDGFGSLGFLTFVDLMANPTTQPDVLTIETLAGAYLGVEFGTSTAGTTVVDADWAAEAIGTDDADIQIVNTESLSAIGDQAATGVTDFLLAGGDMFATTIPFVAGGGVTVPGTPDTGADITGSDPSGNLDVPITLLGGPGDDQLEPGNGDDIVNGGAGDDVVIYGDAGGAVNVDLEAAAPQSTGGSGNDTLIDIQSINGSRFDDTLLGSAINNRIGGCLGDDVIDGRAGDDMIAGDLPIAGAPIAPGLSTCAGPGGDDLLTGGTGNDTVTGDGGDDTINEEAAPNGADVLSGGPGFDTLDHSLRTTSVNVSIDGVANDGGTGENDNVAADFELYLGGSAADTYSGGAHDETFRPGGDDDIVDGNGDTVGADVVPFGGDGFAEQTCTLGGADCLDLSDAAGPAVFDLIAGTATGNGTDTFSDIEGFIGTAGDDSVVFDDAGFPTDFDFVGGGGIDTIDGTATLLGFVVDLSQMGDTRDVENALGGAGDDVLIGNSVANRLIGNDGFDFISGGGANDFIEGGPGNDTLLGGIGGDTLSYANSACGMLVDAQLGFTDEIPSGCDGDGQDSIGGFEIFLGSDFDDEIIGGQTAFDANIRIKGGKGDDNLVGTNSSDTILGGPGNDVIRAGGGDDIAKGGAGNDLVQGGNGDDILKGGKGDDTGIGGKGFDVCKGFEQKRSCEA